MRLLTAALLLLIILALPSPSTLSADDGPVCSYVYSLTDHPVDIPCEYVEIFQKVFLSCESRTEALAGDPSVAVGALGERGFSQIHPIHAATMARLGLSFYSEHDLVLYTIKMLDDQGVSPWSCAFRLNDSWDEIIGW